MDPLFKEYPWYTPYQFAANCTIKYIDLDGAEPAAPPSAEWEIEEGFRQLFDGFLNAFSFAAEGGAGVKRNNFSQKIGNTTISNTTDIGYTVGATYTGWDLFNPSAYPKGTATAKDIPLPKINAKSELVTTNETEIKTTAGPVTYSKKASINSKGEVKKTSSQSISIVGPGATPLTTSWTVSESNQKGTSSSVKFQAGPTQANIYINNTETNDSKTITVGGQFNIESPEINKTKVYVKGKAEISVKDK